MDHWNMLVSDIIRVGPIVIALIVLIYQIKAFKQDSKFRYMEKLDNWLASFRELERSPNRTAHVNWATFAVNYINQADIIATFAMKGYISKNMIEFFKAPIASAYSMAFNDMSYLKKHFAGIVKIDDVKKNAVNLNLWCQKQKYKFGDELLPNQPLADHIVGTQ